MSTPTGTPPSPANSQSVGSYIGVPAPPRPTDRTAPGDDSVVDERFVQQRVESPRGSPSVDPADIDPLRRSTGLERFVQIDLHVPEVMDGSESPGAEHRRGGIVSRVDRVLETERRRRGRQLGSPLLDPVQQRSADTPAPVLGVDDSPGPCDVRLLERDLCVPDDLPGAVDRHPGIGGEVAQPAPFTSHEVLAQHDLSGTIELVGDDHIGHRIKIGRRRRSELVRGGIVHVGNRIRDLGRAVPR